MDEIQFLAQVGSWVCVKKHKVENGAKQIEVARALASIHDSMNRKIWDFIKDDFNLEELDKLAYEITDAKFDEKKKEWLVKGRVSEPQLAEALSKLNNPTITRRISATTPNGREIAKSYLTRRVLDLLGFRIELDPKAVDKYLEEKAKLGGEDVRHPRIEFQEAKGEEPQKL